MFRYGFSCTILNFFAHYGSFRHVKDPWPNPYCSSSKYWCMWYTFSHKNMPMSMKTILICYQDMETGLNTSWTGSMVNIGLVCSKDTIMLFHFVLSVLDNLLPIYGCQTRAWELKQQCVLCGDNEGSYLLRMPILFTWSVLVYAVCERLLGSNITLDRSDTLGIYHELYLL